MNATIDVVCQQMQSFGMDGNVADFVIFINKEGEWDDETYWHLQGMRVIGKSYYFTCM